MKWPKLDKRQKVLLLGGVVLLFVAILYRLAPEFEDVFPTEEQIALMERQVVKQRLAVQEEGTIRDKQASLTQALGKMEHGLLGGNTPSIAAAELQNVLHGIASKSRVEIKTVRVLKAEESENQPYLSVPVQFTMTSSVAQLKDILYAIEIFPKYLTIEKFTARVPGLKSEGVVHTDITLVGYMKRSG